MPSNFDFYARYGLFTYSQCSTLCGQAVSDLFGELGAECIVAREHHADGGTHLHVFADFERRRRFRRANFADIQGYHPNIVSSYGTPWDGYDYCIKDGDVVAGGLARPDERRGDGLSQKDKHWHQIVAAHSREEFFELLRDLAPGDLARCFPSLSKFADWAYATPELVYDGPSFDDPRFDTSRYPELDLWRLGLCEAVAGERGKSAPRLFFLKSKERVAPLPGPLAGPRGAFWRLTPPLAQASFASLRMFRLTRVRSNEIVGALRTNSNRQDDMGP